MFEKRPPNQQRIIEEIQKHQPCVILQAKKQAGIAESEFYMPMTTTSLKHLLDICDAIRDGKLKEFREGEKTRSQKELG